MRKRRAFRHRIRIESPITSKSASGQSKITGWQSLFDNVPAHFQYLAAGETFRGRQIQADVSGVFEIRRLPVDIPATNRVVFLDNDNKAFNIVSVREYEAETEGNFRYYHIFVKALADA